MKYLMNDISLRVAYREYFSSGIIAIYPGILCIAGLLLVCAMPIQHGWNDADMIYCRVIPLVAVVGTACCVKTKSYLRFGLTDILALLLYGYFIIRYYLDRTYPAESMAIHATLALCLYFSLRLIFDGTRISGKTVALMILLYAVYEAGYGIVQLLSGTSRHNLYPVTGSFHNPGPYSACITMGLVIICACLKNQYLLDRCFAFAKSHKVISSIQEVSAALLGCIIIITMSRTAIIASIVCLFILFGNNMGRWKWIAIAVAVVLGIGLYFVKVGSADGRMVINYVGLHAVADNLIFGSGIGGFFHKFAEATERLAISDFAANLNAVDVIEYAFNDWLRIATELGLTGLVLTGVIVINSLRNLWIGCKTLFLTMIVILFFSIFSYPIELLPYRIMTILIIAFSGSQRKGDTTDMKSQRIRVFAMIVMSLVIIGIPLMKINCIKEYREAEKDYNIMRGIQDLALIKDYEALFPLLEDNRNFLFDYGRLLSDADRYNDSNDILRKGASISNDPMFLVLQGNNYRDMGAFDKAEEMYLKASHTMPNRIYPLYRLMMLYNQAGNESKAVEYASIIVNHKEKVASPAVNDIKREAHEIINVISNPQIENKK